MDHRWLQLATGHGTLDSGALSDPATVRRWACDADIVPIPTESGEEMARAVRETEQRARHETAAYYERSFSWRLTRPLRALRRRLQRGGDRP